MSAARSGARAGCSAAGAGPALGPAVFALAHHDDEVFCAGHLHRALCEGRSVRLLWATSGGLASARRRRAEGERVRRLLAPAAADWRDLGLPDQGAVFSVDLIADELEALLGPAGTGGGREPLVYVPAFEGGHPDHDALNLAVAVLRTRRLDLLAREFPLYRRGGLGLTVQAPQPAAGTRGAPFDTLFLSDDALALRRRLALANGSQLLPSLIPLLALARGAGRQRREPSRPLPPHRYAQPPGRRPLLYELYTRRRFAEFRAVALASLGEAVA